ncbi:DUF4388 domain-containing protein [Desulfobacterales bacterium HSG2]|nr:DUF4388 domain-containing protein [Desulfobacterales bacterium HSG2]
MAYKIKEFKPCPFCGRIWMIVDTYSDGSYAVRCPCGTVGPVREDKQGAAKAWNTRGQLLWNPFRFSIRFSKDMLSVDLKGKLDSLDFATVLQMLASGNKTGILQAARGHTKSAVCLKDGNIVAASDSNGLRLGQILYNNRRISHEKLRNALRIAKTSNKMIGEVLLLMKYITPETLRQVIRQQVQETVSELFFWKEGYFEYRDCLVEFDERSTREINTMEIILESAREADERDEQKRKSSSRIIIP